MKYHIYIGNSYIFGDKQRSIKIHNYITTLEFGRF